MILTIDNKKSLITNESKLERLYLIQYLLDLKTFITTNPTEIRSEQLNTIINFLESGKAHYNGQFLNFTYLETSEIYSLINKSLTTEQVINQSFTENVDSLLDSLNSIDTANTSLLVNFLTNLISNLNTQDTQHTRNFFDW